MFLKTQEVMPLFSVVVPLYNKQDHIRDTMLSILAQYEDDYEIVVINDGSTDGSERIVQEIKSAKIKYFSQPNKGVSSARNLGIAKASGTYIAFIDADDYWTPNHLSELRKGIELFPDQHVFCTNYCLQLSKQLTRETTFSHLVAPKEIVVLDNFFKYNLLDPIATGSTMCIRTSLLQQGYYFDTDIVSGQDTELWIRLGLQYALVFNPKVTTTYIKDVQNSLSKSNQLASRKMLTERFVVEEGTNIYLKKYIDLNRFSIAIGYKMIGDLSTFKTLADAIDLNHLHAKQRFLLRCTPSMLRLLMGVKKQLQRLGIASSAFK